MRDKQDITVGEIVRGKPSVTVKPEQSIRDVAQTLVVDDVLQVPVVSTKDPRRMVGIVTLHDVARQQNAIDEVMDR